MSGFVQIIEYTTSRIDDVRKATDEFRDSRSVSETPVPVIRGTITADRDRPNTYLSIVEFPSYEVAMENSERPETSAFAARLAELCDGPPRFYNLDVIDTMVTLDVQQRQAEQAGATSTLRG